jgi:hypothetical protein
MRQEFSLPTIVVPPEVVTATQAASAQVAQTTPGVAGTLTQAAGAEGACDPRAAGAWAALQAVWSAQAAYLSRCDAGRATALGYAASAYVANDQAQMVAVWTTP